MIHCRILARELSAAIYAFKSGSRGQPIFAVAPWSEHRRAYLESHDPPGIPAALWRW